MLRKSIFGVLPTQRHEPSIFSCSVYRLLFWFISCTLSWFISCTNQYLRLGMWSYSQQGPICKVFFTNLGPRFRLSIRFTNILLIRENYPSLWTDDFFSFFIVIYRRAAAKVDQHVASLALVFIFTFGFTSLFLSSLHNIDLCFLWFSVFLVYSIQSIVCLAVCKHFHIISFRLSFSLRVDICHILCDASHHHVYKGKN